MQSAFIFRFIDSQPANRLSVITEWSVEKTRGYCTLLLADQHTLQRVVLRVVFTSHEGRVEDLRPRDRAGGYHNRQSVGLPCRTAESGHHWYGSGSPCCGRDWLCCCCCCWPQGALARCSRRYSATCRAIAAHTQSKQEDQGECVHAGCVFCTHNAMVAYSMGLRSVRHSQSHHVFPARCHTKQPLAAKLVSKKSCVSI